jgi:hypothetical protein
MRRYAFTGVLIVIALGIGLWLGRSPGEPSAYEIERASLDIQLARTMLPFKVAFRVLLGGALLLTVGGLGWGAIRWLNHRTDTVYPDRSGLYPIREGHIAGAKVFHDPNRTLSGTTVYAAGQSEISVQHALPQGQEGAQRQIASQAQAAQALRAAVSGPSPLPPNQNLPIGALDERRLARPLPEVRTLDLEPSHIERLLLENGDADGQT